MITVYNLARMSSQFSLCLLCHLFYYLFVLFSICSGSIYSAICLFCYCLLCYLPTLFLLISITCLFCYLPAILPIYSIVYLTYYLSVCYIICFRLVFPQPFRQDIPSSKPIEDYNPRRYRPHQEALRQNTDFSCALIPESSP